MADTGKKLILVVDDEPDVITYLTTLFEDNDFEIITAGNGVEALEAIKKRKPDLITLDISMPERSGVRFYRDVRESDEWKDVPVVIVSGVTGFGGKSDDFKKFLNTRKSIPGPDDFIEKPIVREKLMATIKRLIG